MSLKLLITRHGETLGNVKGMLMGVEDGNITKRGFKQIHKLINKMKREEVDIILSSDMYRCQVTAKEISGKYNIPVEYSILLREKNNGDWTGKCYRELCWDDLEGDFETRHPPDGESLIEVRERGIKLYSELLTKHTDKCIAIVSHSTFLKVFIGQLLGMSIYDSIFKLRMDYCSLSKIEIINKNECIVTAINN